MVEQHAPPLLILCREGERFEWLASLSARRFPGVENPVVIARTEGDAQEAVLRARREHGGIPLGIVVADEATALVALEVGADEAIAEEHLDASSAFGFIDRVAQRARLRVEQEQLQQFYVHSEKLAALGTLVAGVAHEVNNPLTALLLSVEGLKLRVQPVHDALQQVEDLLRMGQGATHEELLHVIRVGRTGAPLTETQELLREIELAAQSIARVVRDLKLFSRADDAEPEVINVTAVLDQVLRIVGRQIRTHATLELDYESNLPLVVAPTARLAQVFTNILLNAAQAIGEVARPSHRIRISARSDDEAVAVCVSDTGPGILADVIGRIFDPFFTTKRPGVGTGLGLSISRSILRRMGGDLLVESVHGDGATFIALIPRPERRELYDAYRLGNGSAVVPSQPRLDRRVLVVDAEERVLRAFARTLDTHYDVLLARDGQEAIDLLESGSHADVIVADVSMPELSGVALYGWLVKQGNELAKRMIFVAAEEQRCPSPVIESGLPVLEKPVSRAELLQAIDRMLPANPFDPASSRG